MADSEVLLKLEHAWADAFHTTDQDFLNSLLAEEFRLSFVDDVRAPMTFSRESWFENLKRMTFGAFTVYESQEVIFGKVGVIHLKVRFDDWAIDGRLLPSEYKITDIYVHRDGRWQVTNRVSEPLHDSPKF